MLFIVSMHRMLRTICVRVCVRVCVEIVAERRTDRRWMYWRSSEHLIRKYFGFVVILVEPQDGGELECALE